MKHTDEHTDHIYLPLKKVEKEIRSEFDSLLRRSFDRLEELAQIEMELWLRIDKTKQDGKNMFAEVERKTKEQVLPFPCDMLLFGL